MILLIASTITIFSLWFYFVNANEFSLLKWSGWQIDNAQRQDIDELLRIRSTTFKAISALLLWCTWVENPAETVEFNNKAPDSPNIMRVYYTDVEHIILRRLLTDKQSMASK